MPQTIGNTTLLGTVAALNLTTTKRLFGTTQETVLAANQRIKAVHIGWAPGNGSAAGSINVCLYDQGNASANKPVIPGSVVNIPYDASTLGASARWIDVTGLAIDLSAHAGKTLAPGLAPPAAASNSGFSVLLGTVTGATRANTSTNSTTNTDPFVQASSTANQAWSLYFETEDIPGGTYSLDSLGPSPVTNIGSLTAVISGNLATGTVTLEAGGVVVTQTPGSWSFNSGTGKTTIVWPVTQGGLPFGAVTAKIVSGATTLTQAVTLNPVAGNAAVAISGALNTAGYIFEQMPGGNYTDVTQVEHTDSPNTVVNANGSFTQTVVNSFNVRALDGSDNTWSSFATITPSLSATATPTGASFSFAAGATTALGSSAQDGTATVSGASLSFAVGVATASGVQNATATVSGSTFNFNPGLATAVGEVTPPTVVSTDAVFQIVHLGTKPFKLNISRQRGDTKRLTFLVKRNDRAVDISGWTSFKLGIDSRQAPDDSSTAVATLTGGKTNTGLDGFMYFNVPSTIPAGYYFFDAQATDANGEVLTFVAGKWDQVQDITK